MNRVLLGLSALLATAAAAGETSLNFGKYKLPSGSNATAIARFPKGNLNLSIKFGDSQYYGVLRGGTCKATQKLGYYSGGVFAKNPEVSVPIETDRKLRILASIQKHDSVQFLVERYSTCTRIVEFTPEAGKTYSIMQEADASRPNFCAVDVREDASGAPPPDIADIAPLSCKF